MCMQHSLSSVSHYMMPRDVRLKSDLTATESLRGNDAASDAG
jgi:hypothetical protein